MNEFSRDELARCVETLRELAKAPEVFLDKRSSASTQLAEVRREANRLIEAVKGEVRTKRGQPANGKKERHPTAPTPPVQPLSTPPDYCYACTNRVVDRHSHYHWMCQACGEWNWHKRTQQADLTGRVALVTGARVRIGYQTALKLLRAGAKVHALTRFPHDAADRYLREPDCDAWRNRLTIHRLDLCMLGNLLRLTRLLAQESLDILINNAAQTVRPTEVFFAAMHRREQSLEQLHSVALRNLVECHSKSTALLGEEDKNFHVALSQMAKGGGTYLDRRPTNSWMAHIEEITPMETLEVHSVNALAPFLLIQGLLPALRTSPWPRRFIINVAGREGQFAGKATGRHPHTNMAKAALNMLTRSLDKELRAQNIFINSVDPGWVSDQRPFPKASEAREEAGDWLPLDDEDAAARLLDLVFAGTTSAEPPPSGKLWRNYRPVEW